MKRIILLAIIFLALAASVSAVKIIQVTGDGGEIGNIYTGDFVADATSLGYAGSDGVAAADYLCAYNFGEGAKAVIGVSGVRDLSNDWVFETGTTYYRADELTEIGSTGGGTCLDVTTSVVESMEPGVYAWTGLDDNCAVQSETCDDWTDTVNSGRSGSPHQTGISAYSSGNSQCTAYNALYCVYDSNPCTDADNDDYCSQSESSGCENAGICESGWDDCNDANVSIWQNLTGYTDSDADNYGTGSAQNVCSGASLPSGYASVGGDCNGANVYAWQNQNAYVDIDHDGYTTGSQTTTCVGATSVINTRTYFKNDSSTYKFINTSLGSDCEDNNAAYATNCNPTSSTFDVTYGSTNFSTVSNVSSIPNMTLASATSRIIWTGYVNALGQDFDTHIKIGSGFVSVNASALHSSLNASANVSIDVASCGQWRIYYASQPVASLADLKAVGAQIGSGTGASGSCSNPCSNPVCVNNRLNFTVSHFDGFGGEGGGGAAVPEFGTWVMLVLALGIVVAGVTGLRRKK